MMGDACICLQDKKKMTRTWLFIELENFTRVVSILFRVGRRIRAKVMRGDHATPFDGLALGAHEVDDSAMVVFESRVI
jgi:hypothetical protein